MKAPKHGAHVIYVDRQGKEHDALLTAVWGQHIPCSVNLLYVTEDEDQRDNYGRKIIRESSCVHEDHQSAHGNYWKLPA